MLPAAPHGVLCARLLPFVNETNLHALRERQSSSPSLIRYRKVAALLTGEEGASLEDGLGWLQELCSALNVPPLSAYGLERAAFQEVVEKSARSSSMKGNPIELTLEEMQEILEKTL